MIILTIDEEGRVDWYSHTKVGADVSCAIKVREARLRLLKGVSDLYEAEKGLLGLVK